MKPESEHMKTRRSVSAGRVRDYWKKALHSSVYFSIR